ncbi:oxysterol-binding protein-related protein 1C [Arachis stenosperma]|uniref:oxysterol-binding protein-related protein 1C n=1 Tax=Arachis stenosperma TaxID=217475 RepID=UPI0025AC148D|nr:oxysterol-binding protein-related protein 1C [Arachis stenosperma]
MQVGVNYGEGWRPRWFVLQDGILSYFSASTPLLHFFFTSYNVNVSTIRESKSDNKRFSMFTETKSMHLIADIEDWTAWMEVLQVVKEILPRISNSELTASLDNVGISTEKLRQRLLEEWAS